MYHRKNQLTSDQTPSWSAGLTPLTPEQLVQNITVRIMKRTTVLERQKYQDTENTAEDV